MEFGAKVSQVLTLIEKVTNHINESRYYPRENSYLDLLILALISKALVVSRSVCTLVGHDFNEEAFGLSRTLVDLYLTVRYLTNQESEERASRFAHFFAKDREGWENVIKKYYPTVQMNWREYPTEVLEKAKEYSHPYNWTGLGDQTRQMAMEPDTYDLDQHGKPYRAEFAYEVIYKWTSHYVHPTVLVLDTHVVDRSKPFVVHGRSDLAKRLEGLALFNTVSYLRLVLYRGHRSLGTELPGELDNEFDRLMKSL